MIMKLLSRVKKKIHIQYQFIVPLSLSLHFEVFVGEFNSPSNK